MEIHKLKIEERYLEEIKAGNKKSEIRINDRDYQKGDILEFKDYSVFDKFTTLRYKITHIHSGLGMEGNYVCLSITTIK